MLPPTNTADTASSIVLRAADTNRATRRPELVDALIGVINREADTKFTGVLGEHANTHGPAEALTRVAAIAAAPEAAEVCKGIVATVGATALDAQQSVPVLPPTARADAASSMALGATHTS